MLIPRWFSLILSLVLLIADLSLVACSPKPTKAEAQPVPTPTSEMTPQVNQPEPASDTDVQALVVANNRFAFDLYQQLAKSDQSGNLFFSPFSLSTALAMAYAGARGETAAEMARVLHFDAVSKVHPAFAALRRRLDRSGASSASQLVQANALWSATDLIKDYTRLIDVHYGGQVTALDLSNGTEASRVINAWVARQTNDKIPDLVKPDDFNDLCRLVLTNAIYFKGAWDYPFDPSGTQDEDFTLRTGKKVRVPMMRRDTQADGVEGIPADATSSTPFYQEKAFKMVELIYRDRQTSMIVILPRQSSLAELALTPERLATAIGQLKEEAMEVKIPKFSFQRPLAMEEPLIKMGMKLPFAVMADFSGMTKNDSLFIDHVVHQARIDVDEQGSEAAAATAVFMHAVGTPEEELKEPPSFIADRPFLYLIRDRSTGTILFFGREMDPLPSKIE